MKQVREYQEFHLTPQGWVKGTLWHKHGFHEGQIPKNRVLTIQSYFKPTSAGIRPIRVIKTIWRCNNQATIDALIQKFGTKPASVTPLTRLSARIAWRKNEHEQELGSTFIL
jgi:hypothetical protein